MGLAFSAVGLVVLSCVVACVVAALPWPWTGRGVVPRVLRGVAWSVVALALVLAATATRRTVRAGSIDDHLATVPSVGRIRVGRDALPTDVPPPASEGGRSPGWSGRA